MKKHYLSGALAGVFILLCTVLGIATLPVQAAKIGPADTVTLNPGGGTNTNGTDGMRFSMNMDSGGRDGIFYRNTNQYCCSAGAPMLNIGGTLYGQSGPAGTNSWSSIEVQNTTGATSQGTMTSVTGNASATLLYTVDIEGLVYTMSRKVTYTYPNDYVVDAYTFNIPEGNASTVKFYLGGDTAPGDSDQGYGIMLTSPVRSVISLNTSSRIMFGFREVPGSKVFDGATSQHYSAPYNTVKSGGDIGYVVTASTHDAGLMMQWNLGSASGIQTASLQQFATKQGTNLNATLSSSTTNIGEAATLDISVVNTELTPVSDIGFLYTLPSGVKITSGDITNSCNGDITASIGTTTIKLENGEVASGSNCVIRVPINSENSGTYVFGSSNFSQLTENLENNAGALSLIVTNPEIGSDLNGDGIDDIEQTNVFSYTNPLTGKTAVLESSDTCSVVNAVSKAAEELGAADQTYQYPGGLMDFSLSCGTPGVTTEISQYYYDLPEDSYILRKYHPTNETFSTIDATTITQEQINGSDVTKVTYSITDGGELDDDGTENGTIVDPAGLATVLASSSDSLPDTNQNNNTLNNQGPSILAKTGQYIILTISGGLFLFLGALFMTVKSRNLHR